MTIIIIMHLTTFVKIKEQDLLLTKTVFCILSSQAAKHTTVFYCIKVHYFKNISWIFFITDIS